jgi:hypothetical protein
MISPFPPAEFGGQSERAIMGEAYETPGGITESRYQTLLALRDDLRAQDPRVNSWGEFGQAFGKFQHDRGAIGTPSSTVVPASGCSSSARSSWSSPSS